MTDITTALIKQLEAIISGKTNAGDRDRDFADSLLNGKWGFRARGYLTEKQQAAAERMVARLTKPRDTAQVGEMHKLYSFIKGAKAFLKYPKINLQLEDGTPLKIYMSGERSKISNAVNLVANPNAGRGDWLGRVLESGEWHRPSRAHQQHIGYAEQLLKRLEADPHGVASEYGKMTGNCCFCSRPLSDERSVAAGYGPVCADHYGLKDEWRRSSDPEGKADRIAKTGKTGAGRRVKVRR